MKTLTSLDPGVSTGLIVGTYSNDTPFELTHSFQIEGGVEEFIKSVRVVQGRFGEYGLLIVETSNNSETQYIDLWDYETPELCENESYTILCEKFTARGTATGPFALKTDALEPLRVEGAILAMGIKPIWVSPVQQYILGGKDKAEKKKRQHAWLKEHGYYIAPKDVGTKDADDVRSATAHAISWLRRQKHQPTLDMFREDGRIG